MNVDKLCEIIFDTLHDYFVCVNKHDNKWWYFEDHRWNYEDGLYVIPKILDNFIDTSQQTEYIYEKLKDLFFKNDFEKRLNSKFNLIGFKQGVYDLKKGFRSGRPDDYISYCTGYEYKEYKTDDPMIVELLKLLGNEDLDMIVTHIASTLYGIHNMMTIWMPDSETRNTKCMDILLEMCCYSFGEYFSIFNLSSKLAIKDDVSTKNKRMLIADITDCTTGCNLETLDYVLKYGNPIVICDTMPDISLDHRVWDVTQVFTWPTYTFGNDIDTKKMHEYKDAFMWLLINFYYQRFLLEKETNDKIEKHVKDIQQNRLSQVQSAQEA